MKIRVQLNATRDQLVELVCRELGDPMASAFRERAAPDFATVRRQAEAIGVTVIPVSRKGCGSRGCDGFIHLGGLNGPTWCPKAIP